jgi:hypothetical protein
MECRILDGLLQRELNVFDLKGLEDEVVSAASDRVGGLANALVRAQYDDREVWPALTNLS